MKPAGLASAEEAIAGAGADVVEPTGDEMWVPSAIDMTTQMLYVSVLILLVFFSQVLFLWPTFDSR